MKMFGAIDISATGLTAERLRMDLIASNIANANSTRGPGGGPYRRRVAVFAARGSGAGARFFPLGVRQGLGQGVKVIGIRSDSSPLRMKYDPGHPDANEDGYVVLPNVDIMREMVDMITASRAYEANATAIEAAKQMALRALEI